MSKKKQSSVPSGVQQTTHLEYPFLSNDTPPDVTAAILSIGDGYDPHKLPKNPEDPGFNYHILSRYICDLQAEKAELLKPLEFEYKDGRPLLIVKLGDSARGWVPNSRHFLKVRRVLKAAGEDKKRNILLYNFGIDTKII